MFPISGEPARIRPADRDDAVIGNKMASKRRETPAPILQTSMVTPSRFHELDQAMHRFDAVRPKRFC